MPLIRSTSHDKTPVRLRASGRVPVSRRPECVARLILLRLEANDRGSRCFRFFAVEKRESRGHQAARLVRQFDEALDIPNVHRAAGKQDEGDGD
jgi:hypothetical protein